MPQENQTQNLNDLFGEALALQNEKKWDESLAVYQKILDLGPESLNIAQGSVVYHNMSTIAYDKSDFLKAYIWAKKSLSLNPSNQKAQQSLEIYAKKVEIPNIPHQISNYDNLKKMVNIAPVDFWFILALSLVATTVWKILKRFVSIKQNQAVGNFNKPNAYLVYFLSTLSFISLFAAILSYQESIKTTAIVIAEKAAVQTVPGENKPVIYEVPAGVELEVLAEQNSFFQVRYIGAFSGWVSKSQLELMSLTFRQ